MFTTFFSNWTWYSVLLRVVISLVVGTAIGIDRGAKRRGTGARTSVTICLGATLIMLLEQYLELLYPGQFDISRMASQVISGVGFVGAGAILMADHRVKGMTSAASIWACACVGLAVGIGFVDGAVALTLLWLVGLHFIPKVEEKVYKHSKYTALFIEVENGKAITCLARLFNENGYIIDMFTVDKPKVKGQNYTVLATVKMPRGVGKEDCLRAVHRIKGVVSVNEIGMGEM